MTGRAIRELDPFLGSPFLVAGEAPTHIHSALRLSHSHRLDWSVALLAVQARIDVRLVSEADEFGHDCDWYPRDGFISFDIAGQLLEFGGFFLDLLVAAPAFCYGRQPRIRTPLDTGMTKRARSPNANMSFMRKLDGLFRRSLSQIDAADSAPKENQ